MIDKLTKEMQDKYPKVFEELTYWIKDYNAKLKCNCKYDNFAPCKDIKKDCKPFYNFYFYQPYEPENITINFSIKI